MAEIKDCKNKQIKIGKTSITIKDDKGKTCGIVKNIQLFNDIQANKQIDYFHILKKLGVWGNRCFKSNECVINDGMMYIFRNLKTDEFVEKYGFFSDSEERHYKERVLMYDNINNSNENIEVIECYL